MGMASYSEFPVATSSSEPTELQQKATAARARITAAVANMSDSAVVSFAEEFFPEVENA